MTPQYIKRIRINATSDLDCVTHHVVLVQFIQDGFRCLVEESLCNPPEGLPIEDLTAPVGSPWK